jgi:hypothetical protein
MGMASSIPFSVPPNTAATSDGSADEHAARDAILQHIASMLSHSYAIGESPEDWWRTFTAYQCPISEPRSDRFQE